VDALAASASPISRCRPRRSASGGRSTAWSRGRGRGRDLERIPIRLNRDAL
jgi:hypothetical protein